MQLRKTFHEPDDDNHWMDSLAKSLDPTVPMEQDSLFDDTQASKTLEEQLSQLMRNPPEVEGTSSVELNTPFKTTLVEAMQSGEFYLRSTLLGRRWAKACGNDPELAASYKVCTNPAAKKQFRQAWVAEQWQKYVANKSERHIEEESEMVAGQFKPVSVAIAEQGGGSAGIKAITDFHGLRCESWICIKVHMGAPDDQALGDSGANS